MTSRPSRWNLRPIADVLAAYRRKLVGDGIPDDLADDLTRDASVMLLNRTLAPADLLPDDPAPP